ncbi:GNAT family N-acetyltransferase [Rhodobacterales bacterium HKCCE4037]|nr:GNAT family N-acetyltransferase [Rhodobacterales bacterium HKCCE4037]
MVSKVETNPPDVDLDALLALLRGAFAYMDTRIDPPSSLTRLDRDALRTKLEQEDLFVIGHAGLPIACLFGASQGTVYYVGKLAVDAAHRNAGLARMLIEQAAQHARAGGHQALELQSRVELVENHAAFARMGFVKVAETAHPGYSRPTSFTFRRPLPSNAAARGL